MLDSKNNKLDVFITNQVSNTSSVYIYKYIISNRNLNNVVGDCSAFLYTRSYDPFNNLSIFYYIDTKLVEDGFLIDDLQMVPDSSYFYFNKTHITNNKHSIYVLLDNIIKGIENSQDSHKHRLRLDNIRFILHMIILQS